MMDKAKFYDLNGFLKPYGENGILFTSEQYLLRKKAGLKMQFVEHQSNIALRTVMNNDMTDITFGDYKDTWSHDNHTGFVCLSVNKGRNLHKKFFYRQWWRRVHPRDVIFYLYAKGGLAGKLAFFFLWIPMVAMVISCLEDTKTRGGQTMLKTDGKILAWLRVNTMNLKLTKLLCNWAIKRNKEFGSWKKVFEMYFGLNHPNSIFSEEIYTK